jgi:hypothetical protein
MADMNTIRCFVLNWSSKARTGARWSLLAAVVCVVMLAAAYVPGEAKSGGPAAPQANQPAQQGQTPPAAATPKEPATDNDLLIRQSQEDADRKTNGCLSCHTKTDSMSMHAEDTVRIGCVDCHGGDAGVSVAADSKMGTPGYEDAKRKAHVQPRGSKRASTSSSS